MGSVPWRRVMTHSRFTNWVAQKLDIAEKAFDEGLKKGVERGASFRKDIKTKLNASKEFTRAKDAVNDLKKTFGKEFAPDLSTKYFVSFGAIGVNSFAVLKYSEYFREWTLGILEIDDIGQMECNFSFHIPNKEDVDILYSKSYEEVDYEMFDDYLKMMDLDINEDNPVIFSFYKTYTSILKQSEVCPELDM
jgi:hypothetical protein